MIKYNEISPELAALIKWPVDSKGKPVDRVVYRWLKTSKMIEKTAEDERVMVDTFPGNYVPNTDTILDGENFVEIAYYTTMRPAQRGDNNGPTPSLLPIEFTSENRGLLFVPRKQIKLFQYLEITRANKDNVNPDSEVPDMGYLFERVKPEVLAESQIDRKAEIYRLGGLILAMTYAEMQALAPKVEVSANQEPKQLQFALLQKAEENPELVNNCLDTEQVKVAAEIDKAIGRKIIEYHAPSNAFVWYQSRDLLAMVPAGTVDPIDALVTFIGGSPDGAAMRNQLRDAIAQQKKKPAVSASLPTADYSDNDETDEEEEPAPAPKRPTPPKKPAAPKDKPARKAAAAPKKAAAPKPSAAIQPDSEQLDD